MTVQGPAGRRTRRRVTRLGATVVGLTGVVVATGVAKAFLLVGFAGLCLVLVRLPRLGTPPASARSRAAIPVQPEVLAGPGRQRVAESEAALGIEGHRAYARALHAVTGAYLAECEREAQR